MNHADLAVFLEEGPAHLAHARHALLAQGAPHLGHAHVLVVEIRRQDFAVTDEDAGHVLSKAMSWPRSRLPARRKDTGRNGETTTDRRIFSVIAMSGIRLLMCLPWGGREKIEVGWPLPA